MTYYTAPGVLNINICPAEMTDAMKLSFAKDIIATVAKFYDVPMDVVMKKGRPGKAPMVRQIASYLIHEKVKGLSLKTIASLFGIAYFNSTGYDHAAIIHNVTRVKDQLTSKFDNEFKTDVKTLLQII